MVCLVIPHKKTCNNKASGLSTMHTRKFSTKNMCMRTKKMIKKQLLMQILIYAHVTTNGESSMNQPLKTRIMTIKKCPLT